VGTQTYVDPREGRVTFKSFYDEWSQRQLWQNTTVIAMNQAANSVTFADLPLGRIKKSHIETWVKGTVARGLAAHTVRSRFDHVRRVFHAAIDDQVIALNPTKGVTVPALRRTEAAMRLPKISEVAALLDAADDDFGCFIALCAFAGLRLGEAAGVQVGDIDLPRRTIKVTRQVQRSGAKTVEVRAP
jgi:integrase